MVTEIRIPNVGETKEDILIVEWQVENYQKIEKGTPFFIIETAKADMDMDSDWDGVVYILLDEGEYADGGDLIAIVGGTKDEVDEYLAANNYN